jgi:uncharacterized protein YqgV (UPF0045/DUF77 family)
VSKNNNKNGGCIVMENRIVCQMSFLPLGDNDGIAKVRKVVEVIKKSGVEYTVCKLSTTITAEREEIFKIVDEIFEKMGNDCDFIIDMRLTSFYE